MGGEPPPHGTSVTMVSSAVKTKTTLTEALEVFEKLEKLLGAEIANNAFALYRSTSGDRFPKVLRYLFTIVGVGGKVTTDAFRAAFYLVLGLCCDQEEDQKKQEEQKKAALESFSTSGGSQCVNYALETFSKNEGVDIMDSLVPVALLLKHGVGHKALREFKKENATRRDIAEGLDILLLQYGAE